jgi:hypothetical protein
VAPLQLKRPHQAAHRPPSSALTMASESLIPSGEYEERRHVADMCRWITWQCEVLQTREDFDEQYFELRDRNLKKLIEEAVPLSRLGLSLWLPGSDVFVT